MKIYEPKALHDLMNGVISGENVNYSVKCYRDAKKIYKNVDLSISDDTIMYEVYTYAEGNPQMVGNLNWGLTIMKPVYVNQECNMTRGHFHEDLNCAEFYFGLAGEGLLLLMNEQGECYAEKVYPNSLHHIKGTLAHRLINTGTQDFKVGACWPTTAGHDYERIEKSPFTNRVYKVNGELLIK